MQIKKTYFGINPNLLFDEVRDFVLKQRMVAGEAKMETYIIPENSAEFTARGTLTFNTPEGKECVRAHIVGSISGETKMMLDIDEALFPAEKVAALESDLDFVFSSYERKSQSA